MIHRLIAILKGKGLRKSAAVRFLLRLTRPSTVRVDSMVLHVDPTEAVLSRALQKGSYEPDETRVARSMVKPGMTALDIGANIGYYTVLLAQLVGPKGTVHAFEPAPRPYSLLRKNIDANHATHAHAHNLALGNEPTEMTLYLNEYNGGDNRLYPSSNMRSVTVPVKRFDDLFKGEMHVDFIKMDIQGAEWLALQGMERMLRASRPMLLMELSPMSIKRTAGSAADVLAFLGGIGYRFHEVKETLVPCDAQALLAAYPDSKERFTNIFCSVAPLTNDA